MKSSLRDCATFEKYVFRIIGNYMCDCRLYLLYSLLQNLIAVALLAQVRLITWNEEGMTTPKTSFELLALIEGIAVADSDYQLGTPGLKTSPDNGVVGHGVVHANLRNGDVFCKQDNRDVERERYIGRQVRTRGRALVGRHVGLNITSFRIESLWRTVV